MALDYVVGIMCECQRGYAAGPAFKEDIRHPLEVPGVYHRDSAIDEVHQRSPRPWRDQLEVGNCGRTPLELPLKLRPGFRVRDGHGEHPKFRARQRPAELNECE